MAGALKVAEQEEGTEAKLVEDLKKKHGITQVHRHTAETGEQVYLRMPEVGVWRRFRSQLHDERKRADAPEIVLRSCLLHPDQAGFDAMIAERPGLLDFFAGCLLEMAGLGKAGAEKKVL